MLVVTPCGPWLGLTEKAQHGEAPRARRIMQCAASLCGQLGDKSILLGDESVVLYACNELNYVLLAFSQFDNLTENVPALENTISSVLQKHRITCSNCCSCLPCRTLLDISTFHLRNHPQLSTLETLHNSPH